MKGRFSDSKTKVRKVYGLTFDIRQLCIVYFVTLLTFDLWNGIHTATVPSFDERIGSHVTAASHVNTIESLPFLALQTSGEDGGLPLISPQDEVGRLQFTTVDQLSQSTHQTDNITASSTITSQTTTDELDPATEPHIIDFTTARDDFFHTSSTEEILGSDTSTSTYTSKAPGHKIPCTPEESQAARCLNGGECSSVQTSDTSRTPLCGCTSEWTGARCDIRYLDPSYWESQDRAKKIGISLGVIVPVIIIIVVLVVAVRRRQKTTAKRAGANTKTCPQRPGIPNGTIRSFNPEENVPLNNNYPGSANGNSHGEPGGLPSRESVNYKTDRHIIEMKTFQNGGNHTPAIALDVS